MSLAGPLRYIGGKHYLADWHVSLFPEHDLFVSLFAGGMSELFAKPAGNEICNDENSDLFNFWAVLRDRTEEFVSRCLLTPQSRELIETLSVEAPSSDPVYRAWKFFMLNRQGYSGTGTGTKNGAVKWSISKRIRRQINESSSSLISSVDGLAEVADRLRGVAL